MCYLQIPFAKKIKNKVKTSEGVKTQLSPISTFQDFEIFKNKSR